MRSYLTSLRNLIWNSLLSSARSSLVCPSGLRWTSGRRSGSLCLASQTTWWLALLVKDRRRSAAGDQLADSPLRSGWCASASSTAPASLRWTLAWVRVLQLSRGLRILRGSSRSTTFKFFDSSSSTSSTIYKFFMEHGACAGAGDFTWCWAMLKHQCSRIKNQKGGDNICFPERSFQLMFQKRWRFWIAEGKLWLCSST